jgi:hypothetical protein
MIENPLNRMMQLDTSHRKEMKCIRNTTMYTYHEHRIRVPQAAVLRVESHCPPSRHPRTKLV